MKLFDDCTICFKSVCMHKFYENLCGHYFCSECCKQLYNYGHTLCPLCRTKFEYVQQNINFYQHIKSFK